MPERLPTLVGWRVGLLLVEREVPSPAGRLGIFVECLCRCGRRVVRLAANLHEAARRGQRAVSCGCLQPLVARRANGGRARLFG